MPLFQIVGMECSDMVCRFGLDEGVFFFLFDRIEYNPLFDLLVQQGVPRRYSTLLWKIYMGLTVFFPPHLFAWERKVQH